MNPSDHSSGFSRNGRDYYNGSYSGKSSSNSNKKNGFFQNMISNGVSFISSFFSSSNSNSNNQNNSGNDSIDIYRPNSGNYNDSSFQGNYRNSFAPSTENDFIINQQYGDQMNYNFRRNTEQRNGYGDNSEVYCDTRYEHPIYDSYYQQPTNRPNYFPNSNVGYSLNDSYPYRRDNSCYIGTNMGIILY